MQQFVSHINRKRLNSHVKDEDENPLHWFIFYFNK